MQCGTPFMYTWKITSLGIPGIDVIWCPGFSRPITQHFPVVSLYVWCHLVIWAWNQFAKNKCLAIFSEWICEDQGRTVRHKIFLNDKILIAMEFSAPKINNISTVFTTSDMWCENITYLFQSGKLTNFCLLSNF